MKANSKERLNKMQEVFGKDDLFESCMEEVNEVIEKYADKLVAEYGYNRTETRIALQEMIGLVDEYTTEEIDIEVEDLKE